MPVRDVPSMKGKSQCRDVSGTEVGRPVLVAFPQQQSLHWCRSHPAHQR